MRKPSYYSTLPEEDQRWIIENYPKYPNKDIAKKYNVSVAMVKSWGYTLHLRKPEGSGRFREGHSPWSTFSEERKNHLRKVIGQRVREQKRKDKARVLFGLEQKTRYRVVSMTKSKIAYRYYMKKYGYILDPESNNVIYYTPETRRHPVSERNSARHHIKILPLPNYIEYGNNS